VELVSEESEEIVITGRATSMDKKHLAHSVSKVSGNDMTLVSAQSFSEALQGKVAGANIQSNSGAPGGGIQIKLRGVSTINANSAPLYVVDGVIMSNVGIPSGLSAVTASNVGSNTSTMQDNQVNRIADLNVNDIENIQILKGASAAAIYGAKASNGVVIITTKRGKPGQTEVSLSQRFGFYQISNTLGSRKYGSEQDVYDRFFDPENPDTLSTAELAASQYRATNGRGYDHEDQLFGNSDLSSETNISIRSGTDVTDYYASLLTRKDAGTLVKTVFGIYIEKVGGCSQNHIMRHVFVVVICGSPAGKGVDQVGKNS
jgi:TonB-dependent SusC/RagA subfamily outer membrane receptor